MHTAARIRKIHRFILVTIGTAVCLIGWGGFVTSIDAGLAVPDWPTSFDSWDPLNPWPEWWTITPVLAEHGHRLLAQGLGLRELDVVSEIFERTTGRSQCLATGRREHHIAGVGKQADPQTPGVGAYLFAEGATLWRGRVGVARCAARNCVQ